MRVDVSKDKLKKPEFWGLWQQSDEQFRSGIKEDALNVEAENSTK